MNIFLFDHTSDDPCKKSLIFLCVPLMCGVCMILNFRMRSAFRKQRNQIGELNARIEDSLLGHKVVKAFTNEEVENEKFEKDTQLQTKSERIPISSG